MIFINYCPKCGSPQDVYQRASGSGYGSSGDKIFEGYDTHGYCTKCKVNFDIKVDIRTREDNDTSHYMGSYAIVDESKFNEYREYFKSKFGVYPEEGLHKVRETRYIPTYLHLLRLRKRKPKDEDLKVILYYEYLDSLK